MEFHELRPCQGVSIGALLPGSFSSGKLFQPWNSWGTWEHFGLFQRRFQADPARCQGASRMKGFETQLNFGTAFAMLLVFVFNFVPRKAEFLPLVAEL